MSWSRYEAYIDESSLAAEKVYDQARSAIEAADVAAQAVGGDDDEGLRAHGAIAVHIDQRRTAAVAAAVETAAIALGGLRREPEMLMRLAFPVEDITDLSPVRGPALAAELATMAVNGSGRLAAAITENYGTCRLSPLAELSAALDRKARRSMEAAFRRAAAVERLGVANQGAVIGRAVDGVRQAAAEVIDRPTILIVAARAWGLRGWLGGKPIAGDLVQF